MMSLPLREWKTKGLPVIDLRLKGEASGVGEMQSDFMFQVDLALVCKFLYLLSSNMESNVPPH